MIYLCVFIVTESSVIKDLMGDINTMDNVCDLLNQKQRTNKVLGWKHLGDRFGIDKDTLDDLSPTQEELECPTEVLIRYLGGWKPYLTITDLVWALHKIDRNDALTVLDVHLPGRYLFYKGWLTLETKAHSELEAESEEHSDLV